MQSEKGLRGEQENNEESNIKRNDYDDDNVDTVNDSIRSIIWLN